MPHSDLALYTVRIFFPSFRKISSKNGHWTSLAVRFFLSHHTYQMPGFLSYYLSSGEY